MYIKSLSEPNKTHFCRIYTHNPKMHRFSWISIGNGVRPIKVTKTHFTADAKFHFRKNQLGLKYYYYYTTPVSQPLFQDNLGDPYQKGKTSLDLDEARDDGVLGHQLEHMQTMCTLLQTR